MASRSCEMQEAVLTQAEMVRVEKLVKVYPGGTRALSGIDFTVAAGGFFGFLGPNGAGKSTTMKILSTLLKKTSGRATVAGLDIDRDKRGVRRAIGFAMQEVGLDDLVTGRDFLVLQGILYGLSRRDSRARAEELLDLVELSSVAERRVGTYSGGMRRRIDLVAALMHNPTLLFLDEPTTGLDPQSRIAIWEYLEQLNSQGITIFLTTQMMEEAERLCQRIAIIDEGRLVAEGSPSALKSEVGGDVLRVAIDSGDGDGRSDSLQRAQELVTASDYVEDVSAEDGILTVRVRDGGAAAPDVLQILSENSIVATNLAVDRPSLDDVFLMYTGRRIRTEATDGDEHGQVWRPWLGLRNR